ncbi:MAG TPA: hypothetical protein VEC19_14005 [Usitatibacter sp.]|nr:hypothetical protein [Usitatibacter sp.]
MQHLEAVDPRDRRAAISGFGSNVCTCTRVFAAVAARLKMPALASTSKTTPASRASRCQASSTAASVK